MDGFFRLILYGLSFSVRGATRDVVSSVSGFD